MTASIGIVGAGVWAGRVHLPSIAAHDGFTVAGVWARRPDQAQALADRFQVPAVRDFDALVERSDVVDFAVPPSGQPELALSAAKQGKHLILEKPVGTDVATLGRLQDEVGARHLAVAVFVNRFFDPARLAVMTEQASTPWTRAEATWRSSSYLPGNPFATPWRDSDAVLWDIGPHTISQLEAILGTARHGQILRKDRTSVDLALHHERGATSTVRIDVGADVPALEEELTLWGPHGQVEVPLSPVDATAAFGRLLDHLADDMHRDVTERTLPRRAGLEEGIRTVRLLQQIASSVGSPSPVDGCPTCAVAP